MVQIVLFIITFVLAYIIYYMISLRPELNRLDFYRAEKMPKRKPQTEKQKLKEAKKKQKWEQKNLPAEINYVILRYHLDPKSPHYRRFLLAMGLSTSIALSIAVTVGSMVEKPSFQILLGLAVLLVLALIAYHIVGKVFQKKGMKKNV